MAYAEFLRVRRSMAWHAGILLVLTLLAVYFAHDTTFTVNGTTHVVSGLPLTLGLLVPFGTIFAMIYASSVGTSLNRENATRDISWTKPISRTMLALQFVLVDAVAIAVVFSLTMLAVVAVLLRIHIAPVLGPTFISDMALGIGVAVMWYALIQMLSFGFGSGARSLAGILWPVGFLIMGLSHAPGSLGMIARAINFINPIAYVGGISDKGEVISMPGDVRMLCAWLFSAAFCAVAIALWPKKEA